MNYLYIKNVFKSGAVLHRESQRAQYSDHFILLRISLKTVIILAVLTGVTNGTKIIHFTFKKLFLPVLTFKNALCCCWLTQSYKTEAGLDLLMTCLVHDKKCCKISQIFT